MVMGKDRRLTKWSTFKMLHSRVGCWPGATTLSITTLNTRTFSIMTLNIKGVFVTFSITKVPICWVSWFCYCYAECRYAECRSAVDLTYKDQTRPERLARDKHSSLIRTSVNYGPKKFYNIWPRFSTLTKPNKFSKQNYPKSPKVLKLESSNDKVFEQIFADQRFSLVSLVRSTTNIISFSSTTGG